MKHGCTIKAVEWAAEYHTLGRALGTVLGTRIGRALSQQAHESAVSPMLSHLTSNSRKSSQDNPLAQNSIYLNSRLFGFEIHWREGRGGEVLYFLTAGRAAS